MTQMRFKRLCSMKKQLTSIAVYLTFAGKIQLHSACKPSLLQKRNIAFNNNHADKYCSLQKIYSVKWFFKKKSTNRYLVEIIYFNNNVHFVQPMTHFINHVATLKVLNRFLNLFTFLEYSSCKLQLAPANLLFNSSPSPQFLREESEQ